MLCCRNLLAAGAALLIGLGGSFAAAARPDKADIVFAQASDQDLALDLYLPAGVERPPLVMFIHGGGWQSGSRKKCPVAFLTESGYAVASVSYRLSDTAVFPAQIHDCKAALRWLRAHADEYGYDASRVAVAGTSAGGHLATLLGVTADVAALEGTVGGNADQSSRVQAIVDYYGPSDFVLRARTQPARGEVVGSPVYKLLGEHPSGNTALARLASPAFHVTADDPPLLVLHGSKDPKVLLDQPERIVDVYQKQKLDVKYDLIDGAGHGGPEFTSPERRQEVIEFLGKHLRRQ
ncbi:alpha/beta hydrolase [Lignipirellula cremea]|uniref:Carboxylesterase NlhH n=1 Tax=Lignipirellula cremea TaxID=2528010 RepID=A0A518DSU3_9BACT|nr:alpha/beta hydrolase [Lignipirellula cremea]QDU94907.1 Carboxylesterase NlhH [Lignipirellula cremea]